MSQVRAVLRGGVWDGEDLAAGPRPSPLPLPAPRSRAGAEEEEGFGPWSPWSPCSKTCTHPERPATKTRERPCVGTAVCSGDGFQEQPCNLPLCSGRSAPPPPTPPARAPRSVARPAGAANPASPRPRRRPPVPRRGLRRPELLVGAVGAVGRVLPQLRCGAAAAAAGVQPPRCGRPMVPGDPQRLRAAPLLQPAGVQRWGADGGWAAPRGALLGPGWAVGVTPVPSCPAGCSGRCVVGMEPLVPLRPHLRGGPSGAHPVLHPTPPQERGTALPRREAPTAPLQRPALRWGEGEGWCGDGTEMGMGRGRGIGWDGTGN